MPLGTGIGQYWLPDAQLDGWTPDTQLAGQVGYFDIHRLHGGIPGVTD